MDFEQIQQLMDKLEASKLSKLVIKQGDFELQIEKEGEAQTLQYAPLPPQPMRYVENMTLDEAPQKGSSAHAKSELEGTIVKSPLVGTFYNSPSPKDPSYVKVGDIVKSGQVLCIIEAMKVMNEITSEHSGKIVEILVDNAQPVEFGQHLFRIKHA